ncbi:MAG: glycosyltransferase family 9 protein [Ignavibacteriaceae bacterium]|nr:glycosyltransferase family 9 protein [Ignavibacteriaceae bacterium]MCU0364433.1 glycosyltransferase family 9 protein [Ignavibacteriaceae bacterium]
MIVRTDRIGDVVLSLPMAWLVKKKYPDCKVAYFIRNYTASLIDGNPFIDEVIIADEADGKILFGKNLIKIKSKNFDTSVVVNPTMKISLMMFLAGIKNRIGTGYRWYAFLFNKKVFEHRKHGEKHELEYNINLLKKIDVGIQDFSNEIKFHMQIDEVSSAKINSILDEKGFESGNKIVIIHPGSGGSSVDLPKEKLIELTRMISNLNNVTIIITGSKSEFAECKEFEISKSVINLAGQLDLSLLKALINKADLFISNSTGPMHIAAALGVHVIGFFPKILSCSQKRWGPYTEKKSIFIPTIDCSNCTRQQCEKLNCMNSIDIGKVFDETKTVVKIL